MKLLERLLLDQILPREGSFDTLILAGDIRKKVTPTQEEITDKEIVTNDQGISWNEEKNIDVDIDFSEAEKNLIKKTLQKLSDEEKLQANMLTLYKTFIQ